jgi:hypothetical protein
MKSFACLVFCSMLLFIFLPSKGFTQNVTLTSSTVAASNIGQGSSFNIVYIVKMDVTLLPVTVNSLQFTLTGTHDADDLATITTWFNPTAPSLAGAGGIQNLPGTFAAPHTYNSTASINIAAGTSGYFIITVTTAAAATSGNTVKINGAVNPVVFGFTTAATVTNNQSDLAAVQTILAAGITLTTSPVAASNIAQGSSLNIIYIVKMDVAAMPVTVTSLQFTLTGTHDADDLTIVTTWFNPTAPSLTGASGIQNLPGTFAAPHTYTSNFFQNIAVGGSGYFIITVTTAAAATSGNTIKINGAVNPVVFGFTTAATVTNNQTDLAGVQTILGAGVILTSSAIPPSNIAQGSSGNIIYIVKMDVSSLPVNVNSLQFTLSGTHDADDLTTVTTWFNPTAPSLTGASGLQNLTGTFAAPHTYTSNFSQNITAGGSGYFIITVITAPAATSGNTVKLNGITDPVIFGFTTSPATTNNQTDIAGTQTILAPGVTLSSLPVAASNIAPGSSSAIVYIAKMDVTSLPLTVNSLQFTLTGTHDADDLTTVTTWFNPTAPSLSGASGLQNLPGTFAAPHTYNSSFLQNIAAGGSGYFIITVTTAATATNGNTIKLNGALNPVVFGFTTVPPVTNNQSDLSGTQTIGGPLPLRLIDFSGVAVHTQEVQLQWITAGELNTKDFEIEWSVDGLRFSKIAVLTAGNSMQDLHYYYLHKLPADGNNYYRLKMNDKDGHFTYSPMIRINMPVTATKIIVRQNPVINFLDLRVRALKDELIVFELQAADGKMVATKSFNLSKGNNVLSWDLQQLAAGSYFISCSNKLFETIKIYKN